MRSSRNATSSVPLSTDVSVDPFDPAQNRSVLSFKRAIDALLQSWSYARDRGGRQATRHTERRIPEARNHPSQTGGSPDHHSSAAKAPSTSAGSPTTIGAYRSSPSTCARSTGRLGQSHEEQGYLYARRWSGRRRAHQEGGEEESNPAMEQERKKVKKEPMFSKVKGEL